MKKCRQGYYYCYTDEKCKPIPQGLKMTARFSGGGKEPEETGIDVPTNGNNQNGNGNGNGGSNGGSNGGGVSESIISEKRDGKSAKDKGYSLRDWFKGGGWKQTGGKYDGKPCAKQPGQTTKPYCRDADDRAAMSKDERNKAAAKKRKEDPNPDRKGKAKMVTQNNSFEPEANIVEEEKKKKRDACYHKVKSRYSVWPSAYASGALVKCRKVGAANWGNRSEEWIVDNAAQYFFNEGINEVGLTIFIEELGVENFIEFINDLAEDSKLIEAYALTGKKKTPKKLPKGTQPAKTTKRTISRGDSKIKSSAPTGAFKKRPAAAKAVETAKEKQPEKKPVKSTLVKGVADTLARGALSAWQGHKAAMKKKKEGGSVASQVGAGLGAAAGAMLKRGKKHLSDDYQYSDWREDFKAMEYEFTDIIKPEPLKGETLEEKKAQKCWPGYEKKGTKKMFGKTYNNCVKKEEKEETNIGGGNLKKLVKKAVKRIDADVDGDVDSTDMKSPETGEFIPSPDGKKKIKPKVRFEQSDWRTEFDESVMPAAIDPKKHREQRRAAKVRELALKGATEGERKAAERKTTGPKMFGEDWQKVNKSDKTDGMSPAAVKAYRRENPGSKLKTAVTGDPKPGSKDAKRRKSFCARSKGQQDMHNIDCSKTPDKPVCKARRRWKC